VVIPTYNERENVAPLIAAIEGVGILGLSVLFVDDSSPDGTAEEIRRVAATRPWVSVLERPGKMGIGSAYQDGFGAALASIGPSILVEMDGDLQHPASALPRLILTVQQGADVALGSRYVPGGVIVGWGWLRRAVSKGANAYARLMLGLRAKDATSGFRAFARGAAATVAAADLPAKGYEFQVATLHLLKDQAKIVEVPFTFTVRVAGKSKLGFSDAVKFLVAVVRMAL